MLSVMTWIRYQSSAPTHRPARASFGDLPTRRRQRTDRVHAAQSAGDQTVAEGQRSKHCLVVRFDVCSIRKTASARRLQLWSQLPLCGYYEALCALFRENSQPTLTRSRNRRIRTVKVQDRYARLGRWRLESG